MTNQPQLRTEPTPAPEAWRCLGCGHGDNIGEQRRNVIHFVCERCGHRWRWYRDADGAGVREWQEAGGDE